LEKRGVAVAGKLRAANWLDREAQPLDFAKADGKLHRVESAPALRNRRQNDEVVAKSLRAVAAAPSWSAESESRKQDADYEEAGIAELIEFAKEAGIKRGELLFDEGSGLSRSALVTPNLPSSNAEIYEQAPARPTCFAMRCRLPGRMVHCAAV